MAFFDDLSRKAQGIANAATDKAAQVMSRAKTECNILNEKHNLERNYRALGEWYVSEIGEEVPQAAADIVAAIRTSQAKLAELEARQSEKGGEEEKPAVRFCPTCGAEADTPYCPYCGTKLQQTEE